VKWVIECVRDGDEIDEHIERLQQGGRYYNWIVSGEVKEYIILDFRTSKPRKARSMVISSRSLRLMNANRLDNVPFLYFIVFSNDYMPDFSGDLANRRSDLRLESGLDG
jgi:hypothetical protein